MAPQNTWMNGRIVPWAESTLHINTEAVNRGASVFEGLRAYRASEAEDLYLFRTADHMHRLFDTSMRFLGMRLAYTGQDLIQGVIDLLQANEVKDDAHIRVVVYFDEPQFGHDTQVGTGAYIIAHPRRQSSRVHDGIRVTLSPWRRLSDTSMSPRVKASANYLNSRVISADAERKGFDGAIALNERGKVSEGPAQNVFMVRDGVLSTPRTTDAILEGITRSTILTVATEQGLVPEEREVDPTELYVADELFFCGTAAEVQPIVEIDHYPVSEGRPGPITTRLQQAYFDLVRGRVTAPDGWLTSVYGQRVPAS